MECTLVCRLNCALDGVKKKKVYLGLRTVLTCNMYMLVDNELLLKNVFKAERESTTQREPQSQEEGHQSPCCLCIFRPHEPR